MENAPLPHPITNCSMHLGYHIYLYRTKNDARWINRYKLRLNRLLYRQQNEMAG